MSALLLTPAPLLVPALFLVPAQLLNSNATFVDKFKLLRHNIGKSEQSFTLLQGMHKNVIKNHDFPPEGSVLC
jgi:hypothetical protein